MPLKESLGLLWTLRRLLATLKRMAQAQERQAEALELRLKLECLRFDHTVDDLRAIDPAALIGKPSSPEDMLLMQTDREFALLESIEQGLRKQGERVDDETDLIGQFTQQDRMDEEEEKGRGRES